MTLCGPGGMGKTALAAEAIWQLMPDPEPPAAFPDGVLFYSFYGRPDPALAFEHIIRSYDETAQDASPEAVYRLLSNKRALLVLDGAEEAENLGAALDVTAGCGVLVTSRKRADAPAGRQDLAPLPQAEALDLLRAWGQGQIDDEAAGRAIGDLLGGLLLAVRLAGRYLAQTGERATEYRAWLAETPLQALDHGQRRLESVNVLLERSLAQVGDEAQQLLAVTGVLAMAPFDRAVLAAALPDIDLRNALGQLVDYGLLRRDDTRYTVTHALIHTYARQRPGAAELVERVGRYYTAFAEEQGKQGLDRYARLDLERSHIMRVLAECEARANWDVVQTLVWAMDGYLNLQGYWTERLTLLETGITAAQQSGEHDNEGAFSNKLGSVYRDLGQVERAIDYYEQALAIAREIGHRQDEGNGLANLGLAYRDLGQVEQARSSLEQALAIFEEIKSSTAERVRTWLDELCLER